MRRAPYLLLLSLLLFLPPAIHAQLDSDECSTTEAWLPDALGTPEGGYLAAVNDGVLYVAHSSDQRTYTISQWNGFGWTPMTTIKIDGDVFDMIWYDSQLYVRGSFESVNGLPGTTGMARWDGKRWRGTGLKRLLSWGTPAECGRMAVYKGELYVSAYFEGSTEAYNGIAAWNGSTWRKIVDHRNSSDSVANVDLVVKDDYLYAGGDIDSIGGVIVRGVARYDGVTWSPVGSMDLYGTWRLIPFGDAIMAYRSHGRGYERQEPAYAVWDSTGWKQIPDASLPQDSLYGYAPSAIAGFNGEVYVMYPGFTNGKVKSVGRRWDGSSWQHLARPNGRVRALIEAGRTLHAVGSFSSSCGVVVHNEAWLLQEASYMGTITGKVYHDLDSNCVQGAAEKSLADILVVVWPGPWFAITSEDGTYTLRVLQGNTVFSAWPGRHWFTSCPTSGGRTVAVAAGTVSVGNDFGVRDSAGIRDMSLRLTDEPISGWSELGPMNGSRIKYVLHYWNSGSVITDDTVSLTVPAVIRVDSTSPAADAITGDAYRWNVRSPVPDLRSDTGSIIVWATLTLPVPTLEPFCVEGTINEWKDVYTTDNHATLCRGMAMAVATTNKKVVRSSDGSSGGASPDRDNLFTYTISFRNVGNAFTRRAEIIDTLDEHLEVTTLQILGATHPYRRVDSPPWILHLVFDDIWLPDSAATLVGSSDSISFSLRMKDGLKAGTRISNQAYVIFDDGAPVATNTVVSTVSVRPAAVDDAEDVGVSLTSAPNPAHDRVLIGGLEPGTEITLWSTMGTKQRTVRVEEETESIDVGDLPNGDYLIVVSTKHGVRTLPLIVTH